MPMALCAPKGERAHTDASDRRWRRSHSTTSLCLGSAVRQDGRSASLTAPNGSAQRTLLMRAMERSSTPRDELGTLELHGTGTALGDPTEAGSLMAVHGARMAPLAVGAAKASVGHAEAASGHVGLLKLNKLLGACKTMGNAQLRVLNPLVGERIGTSSRSPLVLSMHAASAACATCCSTAGVSSFGYSGTIAHAVVRCKLATRGTAAGTAPPSNQLSILVYRRRAYRWTWLPPSPPSLPLPAPEAAVAPPQLDVREHLTALVRGMSWSDQLDSTVPLIDLGIDSLGMTDFAAELRQLLPSGVGASPSITDLYSMSLEDLFGYVEARRPADLSAGGTEAHASAEPSAPGQASSQGTASAPRPLESEVLFGAPIYSPYLMDTLDHPEEYWYAVATELPAARDWFRAHCSLRATVTRDLQGRWHWGHQLDDDGLPLFELPRALNDVSHLVYYCAGEQELHLHHLVFDGFAMRFLSGESTGTRHIAECDRTLRDEYVGFRTREMLADVYAVVSAPLFSAEARAANLACSVYSTVCLDAPPVVCHLIGRLSKELGAPLAEAFYAIVVVLVLQAAGLASGPFLLTDNCRDSTNRSVFGMVQREYGLLFEHNREEDFVPNVARAARAMRARPPAYRRLFSEFAFGEYPELYNNNFDGVLLNFEGVRLSSGVAEGGADSDGGDVLGFIPVFDQLPWENRYERAMEEKASRASARRPLGSSLP